ncbi:MAG: tRNA-specific adenosine deaminase [Planctomycetaceae bacterium]|nr:tRNA-specific adenosine deaminase [Planctomycetaceae bacterium]
MEAALAEARRALREEEVPIGAAVLLDGKVVGLGHNRTRADIDPTGHAEILALRAACAAVGANRLVGATVYTTVEPCFMCAGALMHARVARVVWAVRDPKFGACASLAEVLRHPGLNHRVDQAEGLMADEARALLQGFFRAIRAARRDPGGVGGASAGEPNDAAERHGG